MGLALQSDGDKYKNAIKIFFMLKIISISHDGYPVDIIPGGGAIICLQNVKKLI